MDSGATSSSCASLPDLPRDVARGVGAYLPFYGVTVCGGVNAVAYTDCIYYDSGSDAWISTGNGTLDMGRVEAAGAFLSDGSWWITG